MSHAQRPRQVTVARSTNLMANQKSKGSRTQKRATMDSRPSNQMANAGARRQQYRRRAPVVTSTSQGVIVSNAELLSRSNTLSGSNVGGWFGINPADPAVFGWLTNIARGYGYYRWRKLRLLYVSGCGSTVAGDYTMAPIYDYEDAAAWAVTGSIIALTQAESAVQGPVWSSTSRSVNGRMVADMMIDVDVSRAHMRTPWHIVDASTTTAAIDNQAVAVYLARMFSPNGVGTIFAGSLWADYEIEFRHPVTTTSNTFLALGPTRTLGQEISYPAYPDGTRKPDPPKPPSPDSEDLSQANQYSLSTGDSAGVSGPDREVQA